MDSDDDASAHNGLDSESAIEIFLRVKPTANASRRVGWDVTEGTARLLPSALRLTAAHGLRGVAFV